MKGLQWGSHPQLPTGVQHRQQDGVCATPAPHAEGVKLPPGSEPSPCPSASPVGITCLLEDMLVSVLMLLVSVTTMAEGKREVCEYWGGSCLCVYTVGRRDRGQGKATPALATAGPGMGTGSREWGWDQTAKGRTQHFPPSRCILRQQLTPRNPWGLRGCGWTRGRKG